MSPVNRLVMAEKPTRCPIISCGATPRPECKARATPLSVLATLRAPGRWRAICGVDSLVKVGISCELGLDRRPRPGKCVAPTTWAIETRFPPPRGIYRAPLRLISGRHHCG